MDQNRRGLNNVRRWSIKMGWIVRALRLSLEHRMTAKEMAGFAWARLSRRVQDLEVRGLSFPDADPVVWTQIFHIILLEEYSPPGFQVDRGNVVLDIGANRGVFVAYAVLCGAEEVHAFEPNRSNFDHLVKLVERNRLAQVETAQKAVSDSEGPIKLYVNARHSRHSIIEPNVLPEEEHSAVEVVDSIRLDDIVQSRGPIDLIKMDCEGAEFEILLGASDKTLARIDRMVVEYHGSSDSPELAGLSDRLKRAGFGLIVKPDPFGDPYGLLFAGAGGIRTSN
jgi:FkbM family methyltransferase